MGFLLKTIIIIIAFLLIWVGIENVYANKIECENLGGRLGLNWNTCILNGDKIDLSNPTIKNDGRWNLFKNKGEQK